jgi:hypothetical protein
MSTSSDTSYCLSHFICKLWLIWVCPTSPVFGTQPRARLHFCLARGSPAVQHSCSTVSHLVFRVLVHLKHFRRPQTEVFQNNVLQERNLLTLLTLAENMNSARNLKLSWLFLSVNDSKLTAILRESQLADKKHIVKTWKRERIEVSVELTKSSTPMVSI